MFRRIAFLLLATVAVVVVIVGVRTWRVASNQPSPIAGADAAPAPAPPVDLATTLAEALQYKTISYDGAPPDAEEHARAFEGLLAHLRETFPRTLAIGPVERIAGHSLLISLTPTPAITIDGAAPGAAGTGGAAGMAGASTTQAQPRNAALLYAHMDVVPATTDGWSADPFGGTRDPKTGDIIGRGALDDKASVIAILAATETLLATGWAPSRPVYLAFGHDEEAGGLQGAAAIAQRLKDQRVRLDSLLDEGGAVVDKGLPGLGGRPIAAVAIAEKGVLNVEICATAPPGHSSMPPRSTAIGVISAAIRALEDNPPPRSLNPLVRNTLAYAASEMSTGFRALVANLWLTAPLIESQMERDDSTRPLLGTSQAVTMVSGGVKANVLPERACATVNYRVFPGDTREQVLARIAKLTNGLGVQVTASSAGSAGDPPAPSDLGSPEGLILRQTIRAYFPDAVIVPVVSPGATDSRHFAGVADRIFRFLPIHLSNEALASMHGTNERVSAEALTRAYQFYVTYLRAIGR